jgi:tetratricopeptide (TPR) repeat protein
MAASDLAPEDELRGLSVEATISPCHSCRIPFQIEVAPSKFGWPMSEPVRVWSEDLALPTYLPEAPDKNPMFLERRVYQGSSGRIYPLPFTDRIRVHPVPRVWRAIGIENEYLRVLVLPELGGRIHAAQDKVNGYDFIYRQPVIKPALVGLAGPWISGGIEFNWPQHHRPGTFLPTMVEIESGADGSKTVWCWDHDPLTRMRGMHGVCLRPGIAVMEVKVRAHNRTTLTQSFLWWANAATEVHEDYQSFFPEDVVHVADHARRAMSTYPLAEGTYYGVDYGRRGREGVPAAELPSKYLPGHEPKGSRPKSHPWSSAANDLSFYANIPVPTSYMVVESRGDFFGGYDHRAGAGIVHVADHRQAPGKKQWTWGNHEFGYAWDRNLTDPRPNGEIPPYIELMAGVFTDNQPDFSFLAPGETRSWSQYWYPIREVGPVCQANEEAALSVRIEGRKVRLGVQVTASLCGVTLRIRSCGRAREWRLDLAPARPWFATWSVPAEILPGTALEVDIFAENERPVLHYERRRPSESTAPRPAVEPPAPSEIANLDELYHTGLHLEQYRHATRSAVPYWQEALRRDPGDFRCNTLMGQWHLRRGEFELAEGFLRSAIGRATERNANPRDGEAHYLLGLVLRHRGRLVDANEALAKAAWNRAWSVPALFALAELACRRKAWKVADGYLETVLRHDSDHVAARNLRALVWRRMGRQEFTEEWLTESLRRDPGDLAARFLKGEPLAVDAQMRLDVAHDFVRAGFYDEACAVLEPALEQGPPNAGDLPNQSWGTVPLVAYTLGWLRELNGDQAEARRCRDQGRRETPDYCFPARLEEIEVFESAIRSDAGDPRAPYYLGNLFYDRRRHEDAIRLWKRSASLEPGFAIVWRNLGIASFNVRHQPVQARQCYERALRACPTDARLLYERDQLWKKLGIDPKRRLKQLEMRPEWVMQRDDLAVELCALYNQSGNHERARAVLDSRRFQPWEGGEGLVLAQHVRAELGLGRERLRLGDLGRARTHFEEALRAPENLGEARHLLSNDSQAHYWCGVGCERLGAQREAREHWEIAAHWVGDFQEMRCRPYSEMTFYSAMALRRLRRDKQARQLLQGLLTYARRLERQPATLDYFATSLPAMLLFEEDLQARQTTTALLLQAQACRGLGQSRRAASLVRQVLARDPSQPWAADLVSEEKSVTDY